MAKIEMMDPELDDILCNINAIFDFAYEHADGDEDFEKEINKTEDRLHDYLRRAGLITMKEISLI